MKTTLILAGMLAFLASCHPPKTGNDNPGGQTAAGERLTYFSFDHHNSMRIYNAEKYNVKALEDGRVHVLIDEGCPEEKEFYLNDSTILDELLEVLKTYKTDKYKEDYRPRAEIFDGDSWSLYYKYNTGRRVSSGGYMAWPDNYHEMRQALGQYFQKWREREEGVLRIDYFRFTCKNAHGCDIEYILERGEPQATLTLRNAEKGINQTLKVSNDCLHEFQQVANTAQLRSKLYDYDPPADQDATRCTYLARYNTGDSISGTTGYTQYAGSKERAILGFFDQWVEKDGKE